MLFILDLVLCRTRMDISIKASSINHTFSFKNEHDNIHKYRNEKIEYLKQKVEKKEIKKETI